MVEGVWDGHSRFGRHVSSLALQILIPRVVQRKKRIAKIGAELSNRLISEVTSPQR